MPYVPLSAHEARYLSEKGLSEEVASAILKTVYDRIKDRAEMGEFTLEYYPDTPKISTLVMNKLGGAGYEVKEQILSGSVRNIHLTISWEINND